jgi:hypothetical protein
MVSDRRRHGEHVESLTSSAAGRVASRIFPAAVALVRFDRQPAAWWAIVAGMVSTSRA